MYNGFKKSEKIVDHYCDKERKNRKSDGKEKMVAKQRNGERERVCVCVSE